MTITQVAECWNINQHVPQTSEDLKNKRQKSVKTMHCLLTLEGDNHMST